MSPSRSCAGVVAAVAIAVTVLVVSQARADADKNESCPCLFDPGFWTQAAFLDELNLIFQIGREEEDPRGDLVAGNPSVVVTIEAFEDELPGLRRRAAPSHDPVIETVEIDDRDVREHPSGDSDKVFRQDRTIFPRDTLSFRACR